MDPASVLAEGCRILEPLLAASGFQFQPGEVGKGSGGPFASGNYVRANRRLELHFRWTLGLATYHFGDQTLTHEAYMWSVLGQTGGNKYPGFSDDPLQGFRDLAEDLRRHAREFLLGSDDELRRRFDHALAHPKPTGLRAISNQRAV